MKSKKRIRDYKTFDLLNPYINQEVTKVYTSIICDALIHLGISINVVSSLKKDRNNKRKGIIVVRTGDAWRAKKCRYGYIITWIQGVAPEETWLSLRKISRYLYVLLLEKLGIVSTDFVFYCSEKMLQHYSKCFFKKNDNYYIMPCFNEEIDENVFEQKNYSKNIFVYIGGMDRWQCFKETVQLFKRIEQTIPNCLFKVFARDKEMAKKILISETIKNFEVDYVGQDELKDKLKAAKFGFCIRKNIEVNRVATPTKLSNYVSEGIIPIYSRCLNDFYSISKNNIYALCADDDDFMQKLTNLCTNVVNNKSVLDVFKHCYQNHYSKNYHLKMIIDKFNKA